MCHLYVCLRLCLYFGEKRMYLCLCLTALPVPLHVPVSAPASVPVPVRDLMIKNFGNIFSL